jgi:hypothetical protein
MLLLVGVILAGSIVLAASLDHRGYLELCVCVVNALSRALMAIAISLATGIILLVMDACTAVASGLQKALLILQALALLGALFFLCQYVLFLLEVV